MPDPRQIIGRIVAVQGTTPGPASGITYTIAMQDSGNEGVLTLVQQVPAVRWPDELNIRALPVGTLVNGCMAQNRVVWWFWEMPDFGECPQVGQQAFRMQFDENGNIIRVVVPPFESGSGSTGAGTGSDSPAGPVPGAGSTD